MLSVDKWEQGSEFHWLSFAPHLAEPSPWTKAGSFWGSGRDAFRALLQYGQQKRGWKRLWIPAYFCQEVVAAFVSTGIQVIAYADEPQRAIPDFREIVFLPGDVMLRVNYFGLRILSSADSLRAVGVEVIDDHTHDPWADSAWTSNADWCIASLRKTLPIPDGGVLWSPVGHSLPPVEAVTPERHMASLEKFVAMLLKSLYLEQHDIMKDIFRQLALSGEEHIASGDISGMPNWTRALIEIFPVQQWREQRRRNYQMLKDALSNLGWLEILSGDNDQVYPFSCIVVFDTITRCQNVHQKLIEACIYPAVLWPLNVPTVTDIPDEFVDVSERMLSIHCDMRYGTTDMLRIASLIRTFG